MDEETKDLLKKTYELSIENNRMLRRIRRGHIVGIIFKILVFIVITGVGIWVYVYILQPYLEQIIGTYTNVQGEIKNIGGEASSNLKKFFEMLGLELN